MLSAVEIPTPLGNRHGIALITSLMLTLLMTVMVVSLAYRVIPFNIGTRDSIIKNQSIYTADAGINQARYFLFDQDCTLTSLNQWQCGNGALTITDTFTDISPQLHRSFPSAMAILLGDKTMAYDTTTRKITGTAGDSYTYRVYAKTTGLPDIINLVTVAERADSPVKTVVDVGLKFNTRLGDDSLRSKNQGADGSGNSGETLGDTDTTTITSSIKIGTSP